MTVSHGWHEGGGFGADIEQAPAKIESTVIVQWIRQTAWKQIFVHYVHVLELYVFLIL